MSNYIPCKVTLPGGAKGELKGSGIPPQPGVALGSIQNPLNSTKSLCFLVLQLPSMLLGQVQKIFLDRLNPKRNTQPRVSQAGTTKSWHGGRALGAGQPCSHLELPLTQTCANNEMIAVRNTQRSQEREGWALIRLRPREGSREGAGAAQGFLCGGIHQDTKDKDSQVQGTRSSSRRKIWGRMSHPCPE